MFLIILSCFFTVWLQDVGAECPTIISKKEWDAEKPKHVMHLITPVDLVIIQHTVTQTCSNDQSCAQLVRDIQKTHINDAYLWDIGPSFLIANTGKIYEGRGWFRVAVHTYGYNNQSIGIAFIGNFKNQEPSKKALDAARALIQCGVDEERLTADHKVLVHSQLVPTESPGKKLASKVMSWPDWKKDVTEIKKRADTQEFPYNVDTPDTKNVEPESRDVGISTSVEKSRSKREILTTPKEVDLLSGSRDVIGELIGNLRKLALLTLKTAEDFTKGLNKQFSLFLEKLTSGIRQCCLDKINAAISGLSLVPFINKCTDPIQNQANALYNNTEAKAKSCADKRINEVENLINNLGTLSENVINLSNTAVEETRNCTELNLGIQSITEACLNSVTKQTQSISKNYESQRTNVLNTIKSSLEALPTALDVCAKQPILEGGFESTKIISQVTNCMPDTGLFNW